MAAYTIQQHWFKVLLNPNTIIGKKKLERDYDALVELHSEAFSSKTIL